MESEKVCPYCGYRELPDGARLCPMCKRRLPAFLLADKIIPYQKLIAKSTEGFVGRQWVRDEVDRFLERSEPRHFLLLGEPGCGKTSFMAQLVRERGYPHHFVGTGIQTGTAAALDWRDPVRFAESIGYQLVRRYGGWVIDWDQWGIHVSQKVRDLQGLAVGALRDTYQAKPRPPGQPALSVEQEFSQFGAAAGAIGVYVDAFKVEVERLVGQLVVEPLIAIARRRPDEQVIVVVDGLDESFKVSNPARSIFSLLPDGELPANVRLLLSSQDVPQLPGRFKERAHQCWLSQDRTGRLHPGALRDAHDRLIRLAETEPAVQDLLGRHDLAPDVFADRVAAASKGNFLYLYHYAEGLKAGADTLLDLDALPEGLYGIYADLLRDLAERAGSDWANTYKPVLSTLAVARAPLDRARLAAFSGVSQEGVANVVRGIRQFLDTTGERRFARHALYHDSLGAYLVSPDNEDYMDGSAAHGRIADHYLSRYADDWSQLPGDDTYGLDALIHHVLHAGLPPGRLDKVLRAVLDVPFMNARGTRAGWHMPFVRDLEQVANRVPALVVRPCVNVLLGGHRNSLTNQAALRLLRAVRQELDEKGLWPDLKKKGHNAILDAVRVLEEPPAKAIPALEKLLEKNRDLQVRGVLVLALGETGSAEAIPKLRTLLLTAETHVSWCAADGLLALNRPEMISTELCGWLQQDFDGETDPGVRQRLLYALGRLPMRPAYERCVELTRAGLKLRANSKGRAFDLVSLWLPAGDEALRQKWVATFEPVLWAYLGLDGRDEMYLEPRRKDEWLQKRIVTALGRIGSDAAVPHLRKMLERVKIRPLRKGNIRFAPGRSKRRREELIKAIGRAIDDLERHHL